MHRWQVAARCLGGAEKFRSQFGACSAGGNVGSLPRLLYVANFRWQSGRSSAAGRADRIRWHAGTAVLALAGTALRLVLLTLCCAKRETR